MSSNEQRRFIKETERQREELDGLIEKCKEIRKPTGKE